jgi:hypothetical protein
VKRVLFVVTIVVSFLYLSTAGQATDFGSLPGGTVVPIPGVDLTGPGPQAVASGINWTSTTSDSVFGYTSVYGFGDNGNWYGSLGPITGLNADTGTMTFAFSVPVAGVGGFLNYAPDGATPPVIAVYDSAMKLIESTTPAFLTSGDPNTGQFLGFLESSPQISYFTLLRTTLSASPTSR